jgi:hypothetical protein
MSSSASSCGAPTPSKPSPATSTTSRTKVGPRPRSSSLSRHPMDLYHRDFPDWRSLKAAKDKALLKAMCAISMPPPPRPPPPLSTGGLVKEAQDSGLVHHGRPSHEEHVRGRGHVGHLLSGGQTSEEGHMHNRARHQGCRRGTGQRVHFPPLATKGDEESMDESGDELDTRSV